MALKFIAAANALSNTITIPPHKAGDLIFIYALNRSSTSVGIPSGWNDLAGSGIGILSKVHGYKIASSSSEVSGTWSNAQYMIVAVYRGANRMDYSSPSGWLSGSSVSRIEYGAMSTGGSNRWWLRVGSHSTSTNQTSNIPNGTLRIGNASRGVLFDSGIGASSVVAGTQSQNSSGVYTSSAFYIVPSTDTPPTVILNGVNTSSGVEILFTGTDTHDDDIQYKVDIRDDANNVVVAAVSGVDPGFVNKVNSGDTSPFSPGEQVGYTVQSSLSPGIYKCRVQGRDPQGTNTYGPWTEYVAFSVGETSTGYFDGHLGISEAGGANAWTDDINAFDGDTNTVAYSGGTQSNTSGALIGKGVSIAGSGDISLVQARIYAGSNATRGWTDFVTVPPPSGGWTWSKVRTLECRSYNTLDPDFAASRIHTRITTQNESELLTTIESAHASAGASNGNQLAKVELMVVYTKSTKGGNFFAFFT